MSYGYGHPHPAAFAPPPPGYGHPGRRSAPPGVHVIAILQYLGGLLTLGVAALFTWAAIVFANGTYEDVSGTPFADDLIDTEGAATIAAVIAGAVAVFGLITIVLGRKVQRGRQWARVIVIMLSVLSLLSIGASIALTQRIDVSIASVAYPVLCLILLNTAAARSWFRYRTW
jgi:hypothetical protein